MELLALLGAAQDAGPVAVVVEDLHWADAASGQALLTAARRLDRDKVVFLIQQPTRFRGLTAGSVSALIPVAACGWCWAA